MAEVMLSVGSNIDREKHIRACIKALKESFGELRLSSVYESEAVGFSGDNFYNLVIKIETDKPLGALFAKLRFIEDANGRVRGGERFSARTLDIDILTYDNLCGEVDGVKLPRDEILVNAFVLLPLAELAPETFHPCIKQKYSELWEAFDKESQKLWPVEFDLTV